MIQQKFKNRAIGLDSPVSDREADRVYKLYSDIKPLLMFSRINQEVRAAFHSYVRSETEYESLKEICSNIQGKAILIQDRYRKFSAKLKKQQNLADQEQLPKIDMMQLRVLTEKVTQEIDRISWEQPFGVAGPVTLVDTLDNYEDRIRKCALNLDALRGITKLDLKDSLEPFFKSMFIWFRPEKFELVEEYLNENEVENPTLPTRLIAGVQYDYKVTQTEPESERRHLVMYKKLVCSKSISASISAKYDHLLFPYTVKKQDYINIISNIYELIVKEGRDPNSRFKGLEKYEKLLAFLDKCFNKVRIKMLGLYKYPQEFYEEDGQPDIMTKANLLIISNIKLFNLCRGLLKYLESLPDELQTTTIGWHRDLLKMTGHLLTELDCFAGLYLTCPLEKMMINLQLLPLNTNTQSQNFGASDKSLEYFLKGLKLMDEIAEKNPKLSGCLARSLDHGLLKALHKITVQGYPIGELKTFLDTELKTKEGKAKPEKAKPEKAKPKKALLKEENVQPNKEKEPDNDDKEIDGALDDKYGAKFILVTNDTRIDHFLNSDLEDRKGSLKSTLEKNVKNRRLKDWIGRNYRPQGGKQARSVKELSVVENPKESRVFFGDGGTAAGVFAEAYSINENFKDEHLKKLTDQTHFYKAIRESHLLELCCKDGELNEVEMRIKKKLKTELDESISFFADQVSKHKVNFFEKDDEKMTF